jgi:hypothetical protein
MRIAYLTQDQYNLVFGNHNTECSIFCIFQDDVTQQYYLTDFDINNTNMIEFIWVKNLELTSLPEHEYYKFKLSQ